MANISLGLKLDNEAPSFTGAVTLDGIAYAIRVEWNRRDSAWFLSLYDGGGVLLVGSQPMIEGFPLLSRHKSTVEGMPQGDLYLVGSDLIYVGAV